ncbi:MAG: UDP-N-acetylglucosamine 2-epimerase (non-hydrolyzing) [Candidatus Bathyarchaeota archaeon]|nr:UDP-N-acetylglucosamine 2-epimerase (non-hydrolyzing) [Candidatus Bathyarchaeota archaeon]
MYAVIVIGTRPQIIKTAPLLREAESRGFDLDVVHTGQHYDYEMSKIFFKELSMPDPVSNLGVGSGSHGLQTGKMMIELENVFNKLKPDVVLVPGDTNSTLAGALAASKMGIPVAHVESGCRSFDMGMPEEVNRRLTDHCSDLLFCVSEWARTQLLKESIESDRVLLVGDTMYESVQAHRGDVDSDDILEKLGVDEDYFVLTVHRAENTDIEVRLRNIFETVMDFDEEIVFPCHPRTRKRLVESGLMEKIEGSKVRLVEPVGYYSMLRLIRDAEMVLTDSGGVQKEAFWLDTPCVTLRDNTEWRETVELGWNRLVGAEPRLIRKAVEDFRSGGLRKSVNPYDFGGASEKIVEELMQSFD